MEDNRLAVFSDKAIRRVWQNNEWWFSIVDVIEVLTDSSNPRDYWYRMKVRVKTEEDSELSTDCRQLKLHATDGKKYATDCANTETLLRIIQSTGQKVVMRQGPTLRQIEAKRPGKLQ